MAGSVTTTVREERHRRGIFGLICKYLFILYNVGMAWWLIAYWVKLAPMLDGAIDEATRTGTGIGAVIGTGMIVVFWAAGAIVLGLLTHFTRGKVVTVRERVQADRYR